MTKQEASKAIADKLEEIKQLLDEAAEIADEHGVTFHWRDPAYDVGGVYIPKGEKNPDAEDESWCTSSYELDSGVWRSSSYNC